MTKRAGGAETYWLRCATGSASDSHARSICVPELCHPGENVIGWKWIRYATPFINLYPAGFLVGGAIISSRRFARQTETANLAFGNVLIAVGAILAGIGGAIAKAGPRRASLHHRADRPDAHLFRLQRMHSGMRLVSRNTPDARTSSANEHAHPTSVNC
jgi:hypothetical protein